MNNGGCGGVNLSGLRQAAIKPTFNRIILTHIESIMIRLNVFLLLQEEKNRKPLIEACTELVELSLRDKGCVAYDIFTSLTVDNHLMFCETWRTREDLDAHMKSEHFQRLVPRIQQLAEMTLEEFSF